MRFNTLVFAILLFGYGTTALATHTVADYEQIKTQPGFTQFLYGAAEGLMLSQAIYKKNNLGLIYCAPEKLQFSPFDYLSLVEREMESARQPPGKLISVVLLEALVKKFPCTVHPTSSSPGK